MNSEEILKKNAFIVKDQENFKSVKSLLSEGTKPSEICDILEISRENLKRYIDTLNAIGKK